MLAPEKTKLIAFAAPRHKTIVEFSKSTSKLVIKNREIKFSDTAEHVGIIRSSSGNLPHILDRVSAHRKALFAVLPAGLARGTMPTKLLHLKCRAFLLFLSYSLASPLSTSILQNLMF